MYLTIKKTKTIAVVALFLSVSATSFSQTNKLGVSINSLTTNFNYGGANKELQPYKKNYRGFQAGLTYQAGISRGFSIVPELYFAVKGGKLNAGNPLTLNKATVRLNSLEVPVLARFHVNKFYLNAGPYAAYHVGGRIKTEGSEAIPGTSEKISFGRGAGDVKRWDLGLQAGAGYYFSMERSALGIDVRYGHGLTSLTANTPRYSRMLNISVKVSKHKGNKQRRA